MKEKTLEMVVNITDLKIVKNLLSIIKEATFELTDGARKIFIGKLEEEIQKMNDNSNLEKEKIKELLRGIYTEEYVSFEYVGFKLTGEPYRYKFANSYNPLEFNLEDVRDDINSQIDKMYDMRKE